MITTVLKRISEKRMFLLLVVLFALLPVITRAQNYISYTYDNNGNRITRQRLEVAQLKSAVTEYPVTDPAALEEETSEEKSDVRVFPNPTSGYLKIELGTSLEEERTEVKILNLSGRILLNKNYSGNPVELYINDFPDGLYIMYIRNGDTTYNFKIVKGS